MARYTRRRRNKVIALPEITLTPLIDTALTLLIIFMVTAPMIENAIKIDVKLPEGHAQEGGKEQSELMVAIDKNEHIYFNNQQVSIDALGKVVKDYIDAQKAVGGSQERRVWIYVDNRKSCSANTLICVIDRIKVLGGVKDVAIATEKPSGVKAV